ncbi:MAG TPA: sodium/calcium exchanger protein [Candidatus Polarisedimenticolia bacterium]|nr:sodium/calcium exchanger protein [Candidatus Polarisedimenticolia bacterium]
MENQGAWAPLLLVALFIGTSLLMIWALEAMNAGGLEGTVLGTLITPYCTGIGNLLVAFVVGRDNGPGSDVMTNSIVNNVTNMTLLIGLPAIFWSMNVMPPKAAATGKKKKKRPDNRVHEINRLSLLLTLTAVLFFTGAVWALGRDGKLDFWKGLVLVGMFLFWQLFHVYDILKSNVQKNKSLKPMLLLYLAVLAAAAYAQYLSIDWLDQWLKHRNAGFFSAKNLGWLSGWLCALPNGLLAIYYGWRGNPEVVYTSQVGDGHICIPLCVGIFAMFHAFHMPAVFETGMYILMAATLVHMFCVVVFGQLPRIVGIALVIAYGVFLYRGLG